MSAIQKVTALFDRAAQLFDPDGTFRREKLATMLAYALISLCTLLYAFSSSETLSNELGAYIENNQVDNTGEQWFLLQNKSDAQWDKLELRLNQSYTHTLPEPVPPGATIRVLVRDFLYNDFIPHTPRVASWKTVSSKPRGGPFAPADLEPRTLKLISTQGSFTALFGTPDVPGATSPDSKSDKSE